MRWPPYKNIFFDCDSTLTTIEGIDSLADSAGKGWRVSVLTRAAMEGDIDLEEVYAKRLRAVKPTRGQINAIRQRYKQNIVADVEKTIRILQSLNHNVFIVSGGLAEPVIDFGVFLGVAPSHIRAVPIEYDQLSGDWWQMLEDTENKDDRLLTYGNDPLTVSNGKALIIAELLAKNPGRSLLIGDGISDLLASRTVDLFVGFGGVIRRERVRNEAPIYFESPTMAPLLALALGPAGLMSQLEAGFSQLKQATIDHIIKGALEFQDGQLKKKFHEAWEAAYQTFYPRTD